MPPWAAELPDARRRRRRSQTDPDGSIGPARGRCAGRAIDGPTPARPPPTRRDDTARRPARQRPRATTGTGCMHAVVLVGGFGTRLRPLTDTIPKPMLPVAHVPMIVRLVDRLEPAGSPTSCWPSASSPSRSSRRSPTAGAAASRCDYAVEPEPLDTAGAIRFAARHAGIDDTFVVANGDVLTDLDVAALVAAHRDDGRRGDDPPHRRRRSVGVRRRRDRRRRPGPALRREAGAGHRAEQPDQRRHVRVRTAACSI